MPWCEACSAFRDVEELDEAGHCPGCGAEIGGRATVPWHVKVLVAGTAIYLLYRLGQGIDWLVRHVH